MPNWLAVLCIIWALFQGWFAVSLLRDENWMPLFCYPAAGALTFGALGIVGLFNA